MPATAPREHRAECCAVVTVSLLKNYGTRLSLVILIAASPLMFCRKMNEILDVRVHHNITFITFSATVGLFGCRVSCLPDRICLAGRGSCWLLCTFPPDMAAYLFGINFFSWCPVWYKGLLKAWALLQ